LKEISPKCEFMVFHCVSNSGSSPSFNNLNWTLLLHKATWFIGQ
jgi:hypothetical protein